MNILHIDEQTGWRGGEQQASYLIRGLAERGHTCVIAGRPRSPFLLANQGAGTVARIEAPFRGEIDLWSAALLARAVHRYAIDILHAHTSHALTYACLARALARRGKIVASRRVDFAPRPNAFSRWKYGCADRVIAISHRIGEVLREFGVPDSKLTVVHSGVDPARFDVAPLPRSALGVPDDVPLIGNVAALVGHKDHATLISAMPVVLSAIPDAHLVIAGDGPLRPEIEGRIAELDIGHAVHLLGFRDDVPQVLRALDVFVLSSKEEGLGTSVLDAMAAGVPVVATAGGGISEMVDHERTGLLTPPREPEALAQAIIRLLRDAELRRSLTAGGVALVHGRFTAEHMVTGNLSVYSELLAHV